ncbi:MAG: carbamoyltransferase C-terminal domain-containing protein [Minisyncoccia bacterium]
MNVLGLKIDGHDTGAALIVGEKIIAIAEERLTRVKHAPWTFPEKAIEYCLDAAGISPNDLDLVVLDSTSKVIGKTGAQIFHEKTKGRFTNIRTEMIGHHDSHAAAAFLCSPFDDAAILVYDGNGDKYATNLGVSAMETESLYRGTGNSLTVIQKTVHSKSVRRFPWTFGIGLFYTTICRYYLSLGMHNEGKMMGLAAYGNDSFLKQFPFERWVASDRGQLVCNAQLKFQKHIGTTARLKRGIVPSHPIRLVRNALKLRWGHLRDGLIRRLVSRFSDIYREPKFFDPIIFPRPARDPEKDTLPDEYYASVAYAAQKIFERFAYEIGMRLRAITKSENLCVSGGCALNIDANRNFLTEVGFKDLFVQPASSDCGIPLGCALWGKHVILKQPRNWVMKSAALGRTYSAHDIDDAIKAREGEIEWKISENVPKETAKLISENSIIGWFQGGAEYGPRALGNRSILCDARNKDMRDILNKRVKHREMWRPFATSILAENLEDWFDLKPSATTAFMLLCGIVHENKRKEVPSIVHVDNTCRMQTLTKEDNGIYYDLVKEFEKLTGVPLLLNTSFNLGGDPIVETPADALDTFLRTDMDYLVLHDRIVWKKK